MVGTPFPLIFSPPDKTLEIRGVSESLIERVARESKVEVVEGGLNHTNM